MTEEEYYALVDTIHGARSAYEVRLILGDFGWHSDDRMTEFGWSAGIGYSVWFDRWNWHGKSCDKAYFFSSHPPKGLSVESIDRTVKRAAVLAVQTWFQFQEPGNPPHLDANGELRERPRLR